MSTLQTTTGKPEVIQALAPIGEAGYTITVEPAKPMTKRELIQDGTYPEINE